MTTSLFSFRNIFIILALTLIFAIAGCGGAPVVSTDVPSTSASAVTQPAFAPTPTPLPTQTAIPGTMIPEASPPTQIPIQPAINEMRRLTLEFPPKIRAGVEGDIVRLTLEVDDLGNITPTAKYQGNVVVGETIQIPDLYETHNVTAEAQLDLAGMTIQPPGAIYEPLKRGQSATFLWSIRPQETGKYRGTVWLHLGFENRSTGEKDRVAISAQIIEIEAVDFFGFSVNFVRTSGVVGSVIGAVIGFPFLDDILKYLFNRRKKKK